LVFIYFLKCFWIFICFTYFCTSKEMINIKNGKLNLKSNKVKIKIILVNFDNRFINLKHILIEEIY
jgi:hypothetical protein